jgi:AcrR family transcriptional regulator
MPLSLARPAPANSAMVRVRRTLSSEMPRVRSLSQADIAAAALSIIDREGVGALSMRAVANELGVGTMSLYRYVDSREQLEGLVLDLVIGAVDTTLPARASWTTRATILVERAREAIGDHPAIVSVLLTHRHATEGSLRWAEAMLGVLADAGFDGKRRALAQRTLVSYIVGAVQLEHFSPRPGASAAALAALGRRYPHLAETAAYTQRLPADEGFRHGLAVVLRGLAAETRARPSR